MVTIVDKKCVDVYVTYKYEGKSTDKKPYSTNGSKFKELDTGDEYFFDGDEQDWSKQADKYLVSIEITDAPTKVEYFVGDELDLTGMVVVATYTNGSTATLTNYSVDIDRPLTLEDTQFVVSYKENGHTRTAIQPIVVEEAPIVLSSIEITTPPTKVEYTEGETLDLTGIVVIATYSDGSEVDVTENCTFSPANGDTLTTSDTEVTASFTDDEVTKTDEVDITVSPVVLSSIAFTSLPTLTYTAGDSLDLSGAEITATYSNGNTSDVTEGCEFTPADGATLATTDTTVTASYTEGEITETATVSITVS